jgi:dolichol-phosphate mannosyltransferase
VISLVVPTLNEVENIPPLLARIAESQPVPDQIIFVDDGSTDGTRECIRSQAGKGAIELIERDEPTLGLAGAVVAGARAARGEWLVVMDADLSHPPEKIGELLQPLLEDRADMVIGSRYVKGGSTPGWPLWRKIMSRVAAALAYPLTGVHDSMGGFFAMRTQLLLEVAPAATGFKIAFEAIVQGGKNLRVIEVPIAFRDRTRGASKMSFGVALLFARRWVAAMTRRLFQSPPSEIVPGTDPRLIRQSSLDSPAKSSKAANNVLP